MFSKKEYIEIVEEDGIVNKYELITKIRSTRDDKLYYIMTQDETIEEEVNILVGFVLENEDDYNISMVSDDEELDYVETLINKEMSENYEN